jgi:hypothetical protein
MKLHKSNLVLNILKYMCLYDVMIYLPPCEVMVAWLMVMDLKVQVFFAYIFVVVNYTRLK